MCKGGMGTPKLLVPKGKTFLLGPTTFSGPCITRTVTFEIAGTIVAPISPNEWGWPKVIYKWIQFRDLLGLSVEGGRTIEGRGNWWWQKSCNNGNQKNRPPDSVNFLATSNSQLKDIRVINSPMFHVTLLDLNNFNVINLKVDSPESSPNTDGLHTQNVKHVNIINSQFRSGDDCISIGNRSSHVYISDCHCGPGHGVSIGSLGEDGHLAQVNNIHMERVHFYGTMNGARIKTWQDGKGRCHSVSFKNCNFTDVMNPLIIDQHYFSKSPKETSAVKISNITFEDLKGTTNTLTSSAINLSCSRLIGCTGLKFKDIFFTPARSSTKLKSTCINAKGKTWGRIEPPLSCLNM